MAYTGTQPDNGNYSRADERQARADALNTLYQSGRVPSQKDVDRGVNYILTGRWTCE